jgi:CoA:oxalate CoA-transferase
VVSNFLATGKPPVPMGNENFTAAPSGAFKTKQGLLNIAANEQKQFEALCDLIARPDLKTDARFAAREARKAHRFALKTEIEGGLAGHTAAEWEALLNEAGVPAGQVLSVPEILDSDQIAARGFVHEFKAVPGLAGDARMARAPFRVDGERPAPEVPPPELGAQTEIWLCRLGLDDAEIARLRGEGAI